MNKKIKYTLIFIFAAAVTMTCLTYSYYMDTETIVNRINTSESDIEIVEKYIPEHEQKAGTSVTKEVRIRNLKDECFVRMKILVSDSDIAEKISLKFDDTGSWEERDGFWYYRYPLKTGDVTVPLLHEVTYSEDVADKNGGHKGFEIICYGESVQKDDSDKGEDAFYRAFMPPANS